MQSNHEKYLRVAGIKPDDMGLPPQISKILSKWSHKCINVIHDGIDTDWAKPEIILF